MSAMAVPRHQGIDDTSPAIHYSTSWVPADPVPLSQLSNGQILNNTCHQTTVNGGFNVTFNGTAVAVYGSIPSVTVNGPSWTCLLDGQLLQSDSSSGQNNRILCSKSGLSAEAIHDLVVNVQTSGQALFLDYILFVPLTNAVVAPSIVFLRQLGPERDILWHMEFVRWGHRDTPERRRVITASGGSSVEMRAFSAVDPLNKTTWGTYTIDGGVAVNFTIPAGGSATQSHISLFTSAPMIDASPNSLHTLTVTFGGDGNHTALVLDEFHVYYLESAVLAISTTTRSSSPAPTGFSSPAAIHSASNRGTIAGAAIGAAIALLVLAAAAFCCVRRRRAALQESLVGEPYTTQAQPPMPAGGFDPRMLYEDTSGATRTIPSRRPAQSDSTWSSGGISASGPGKLPSSSRNTTSSAMMMPWQRTSQVEQQIMHQHQDSGLRLQGGVMVEVPPGYTVE
ncbi:hypothetical protein C8F01DRAFT_1248248 [Mycena amicta]|nr:hypothetical protein C8F01DRAFT_1248248 [Mycena amicta]